MFQCVIYKMSWSEEDVHSQRNPLKLREIGIYMDL